MSSLGPESSEEGEPPPNDHHRFPLPETMDDVGNASETGLADIPLPLEEDSPPNLTQRATDLHSQSVTWRMGLGHRSVGRAYMGHTDILNMRETDAVSLQTDAFSFKAKTPELKLGDQDNVSVLSLETKKTRIISFRGVLKGLNYVFIGFLLFFATIGVGYNAFVGVRLSIRWYRDTIGTGSDDVEHQADIGSGRSRDVPMVAFSRSSANPQELLMNADESDADAVALYEILRSKIATITTPFNRATEIPFWWDIGLTERQLPSIPDLRKCTDLVEAGRYKEGTDLGFLQVMIRDKNKRVVNVNLNDVEGIHRAKKIGLASSSIADIVVSQHFLEVVDLFSPEHKGRLIMDFIHPMHRMRYTYMNYRDRHYLPQYPDILSFVKSDALEVNNWLTRVLSGKLVGELTKEHFNRATHFLEEKVLVYFFREKDRSAMHLKKYFGWNIDLVCMYPELYKEIVIPAPPPKPVSPPPTALPTPRPTPKPTPKPTPFPTPKVIKIPPTPKPVLPPTPAPIFPPPPPPPVEPPPEPVAPPKIEVVRVRPPAEKGPITPPAFNAIVTQANEVFRHKNKYDEDLFYFAWNLYQKQEQLFASMP